MNYKDLSNQALLTQTKNLVGEERRILIEVLQCLKEVSDRLLFSELGYSSLFEFCIKELKYTEGSAHRRISAMKLLRSLPIEIQRETQEKIKTGDFTLTNLSMVYGVIQAEKKENNQTYNVAETVNLLQSVEHKSKREAEKILIEAHPVIIPKEKERVVSPTQIEIRFIADSKLMEKLERIKNLTAHQNPHPSYADLFDKMAELVLSKIDPMEKIKYTKATPSARTTSPEKHPDLGKKIEPKDQKSRTRYIAASIKQAVWLRDKGKCTFRSEQSNHICNSSYQLEFDHAHPFSLGGENTTENLRLRCRKHNQYEAIRAEVSLKLKIHALGERTP